MSSLALFARSPYSPLSRVLNALVFGWFCLQGRNLKTGEIVAIKIVSLDESDQGLDSIRKEISVLKECNHPNIVRYYGSYFKDDYLWVRASSTPPQAARPFHALPPAHHLLTRHPSFLPRACSRTHPSPARSPRTRPQIVMEYCGGGDLDRYLRQYGPLAEPLALACMQQLGTWRGGSLGHSGAWAGS